MFVLGREVGVHDLCPGYPDDMESVVPIMVLDYSCLVFVLEFVIDFSCCDIVLRL